MIVRCAEERLNEEQSQQVRFGIYQFRTGQHFNLVLGKEYVVFGISIMGGIPWVEILSDLGYIYSVPLCLFEIVGAHASHHWEVRLQKDGTLTLWPSPFYQEHFFDRLSDGVPEIAESFRQVRVLIESEAKNSFEATPNR